jgi:predicted amidohydrolase
VVEGIRRQTVRCGPEQNFGLVPSCRAILLRMSGVCNIRASVVQASTSAYNLEKTLEKLEHFTRLAKDRDATDLVVFPEAFIGGYPKMSTFGAVVGERSTEGREEYLRYFKSAIEVNTGSAAISRMESVARNTGVFLVVGVIERDIGTLYCTVVFITPVEGYIAKHRKLIPTGSERLIWGQGQLHPSVLLELILSIKAFR